jgi:hypothetical protein
VQKPFGGGATGGSLPTILFAPEKTYSTFFAQTISIRRGLPLAQFRSRMASSFIRQETREVERFGRMTMSALGLFRH